MSDPFKPDITKKESIEIKCTETRSECPDESRQLPAEATACEQLREEFEDHQHAKAQQAEHGRPDTEHEGAERQDGEHKEAQPEQGKHKSDPENAGSNPDQPVQQGPVPLPMKKKSPQLHLPIALCLSVLPLLVALVTLFTDPAAMPYFKARFVHGWKEAAVVDFSQALKARRDLDILRERATLYGWLGRWDDSAKDLQELADNGIKDGDIYERLATARISSDGVTDQSMQLLRKAIALSEAHCQSFAVDFSNDSFNLYRATYELLCCGDNRTVLEVCKMKPQRFMQDEEIRFLQALAYREQGQDQQSQARFGEINVGDLRQDQPHAEVYYFRALAAMDHSDQATAEENILKGTKLKRFMQNGWLRDLTSAWLLYQQGHYDEALKKTDKVNSHFEEDDEGIPGYQADCALTLLRAHIYLKQNQPAKAKEELDAYKGGAQGGKIFVPKVYRNWIAEAQARRQR